MRERSFRIGFWHIVSLLAIATFIVSCGSDSKSGQTDMKMTELASPTALPATPASTPVATHVGTPEIADSTEDEDDGGFWGSVKSAPGSAWDGTKGAGQWVWDKTTDGASAAWDWLSGIGKSVGKLIVSAPEWIWEKITSLFHWILGTAIGQMISDASKATASFVGGISEKLSPSYYLDGAVRYIYGLLLQIIMAVAGAALVISFFRYRLWRPVQRIIFGGADILSRSTRVPEISSNMMHDDTSNSRMDEGHAPRRKVKRTIVEEIED